MFNNSKTETIPDPVTGETIERKKVPPQYIDEIMKSINNMMNLERDFNGIAQQYAQLQIFLIDRRKEMDVKRNEMHRTLQLVCKKMGLRKDNWIYNIPDKTMELRKAPKMPETIKPPEQIATNTLKNDQPR